MTSSSPCEAAPLMPHPLEEDGRPPPSNEDPHPAVTTGNEVEHLKPEEVRIAQKETAPARGKLRPGRGVLPNEVPRLGKSARSDKPQLRTSFHRPVAVFLPTHEPWHQILNFATGLPKRCRAGTPSPTIPLRFSGMAKAVPVRAWRHPDEER